MPRLVRLLAAALALGLAVLTAVSARQAGAERAALAAQVSPLLVSNGGRGTLDRLRSEPDLAAARAQLARALVIEALQPEALRPGGAPSAARRRLDLARVELAQTLAITALARRPASSEAALALGAATYLDRSLRQDNRLFTEARSWEKPLLYATALAPGRLDSSRFLSRAYLEIWSVLPAWKREEAQKLLAQGMRDRDTFERLIEPWLGVAGSLEAGLALVPPKPFAWERLGNLYAQRRDWPAFARAANGLRDALAADARERLAAAESELAERSTAQARADLLAIAAGLPVDGRFAPLFAQVVAKLPAGPLDPGSLPTLPGWIGWVLEHCEPGRCPLPATVLGRLLGAADELSAADRASLALLADDLAQAELIERRLERAEESGWLRFRRIKAATLLRTGDAAGAEAALRPFAPADADADLLLLAHAVAERRGQAATALAAERALAALAAGRWPASAWERRGRLTTLDLYTAEPVPGLTIELLSVPAGGAVVHASLDGTSAGTFALAPGQERLVLPFAAAAGRHRLVLEHPNSEPAVVGEVALSSHPG